MTTPRKRKGAGRWGPWMYWCHGNDGKTVVWRRLRPNFTVDGNEFPDVEYKMARAKGGEGTDSLWRPARKAVNRNG